MFLPLSVDEMGMMDGLARQVRGRRFPECRAICFRRQSYSDRPFVNRIEREAKVGQSRLPDTWISLQDYYDSQATPRGSAAVASAPPAMNATPPSVAWIDASDYFLKGVRVAQPAPDPMHYCVTLKEEPPEEPPPPEAKLTIYDALKQIHSVYGPRNAIFSRLRLLEQQDQNELNSGRIDAAEFQRRAVASAIIRENHGRRMEEITKWYLDNYFRIFENPSCAAGSDEKPH
ncbi:MAG: hypothetical protein HQL76_02540 [Magnetococcales bacterium]|nr:hypothetical protein [Magnetococcales bacterium]